MTLREFIKANREELDQEINGVNYRHNGRGGRGVVPNPPPQYDDEEIEDWISNDEGLYNWARSEGVRI